MYVNLLCSLVVAIDALINAIFFVKKWPLGDTDLHSHKRIDVYCAKELERILNYQEGYSLENQLSLWRLLHYCILGIYRTKDAIVPGIFNEFLSKLRFHIQSARISLILRRLNSFFTDDLKLYHM